MTTTMDRPPTRHKNARPDGPLSVPERNAVLEAWLARWPYPLAFLLRTNPRLVRKARHLGYEDEELNAACAAAGVNAARLFDPARGVKFTSFVCWHLLSGVEQLVRRASSDQDRRGAAKVISLSTPVPGLGGDPIDVAALITDRPPEGCRSERAELASAVWAAVCRVAVCRADFVVAELRWGLNGRERHGLREIADVLGVTKESVRQREAKLKRKLRKELEDFYRDTFGGDDQ